MTPEEMTLRLNSETDRQTDTQTRTHTEAGGWTDKQIEHGAVVTHTEADRWTHRD